MSHTTHELSGTGAITQFMLAGNAHFTLLSNATGNHFTYRLSACEGKPGLWFLSVLTGSNNESDYSYAATLRHENGKPFTLSPTAKSRVAFDAPSMKAFRWFFRLLFQSGPEGMEQFYRQGAFYHEGKCGRCGRTLTTPESVERGIGPECAKMRMAA